MNCPICNNQLPCNWYNIDTANIDNSFLYKKIDILRCSNCGHVFNNISDSDIENLKKYYIYEYIENSFSQRTHDNDFFGIDLSGKKSLIVNQNNISDYILKLLLLNDGKSQKKYDFIALEQFLEHGWRLSNIFNNINNMLNENAILYISVPDFVKYNENYTYFYLIKEHIHHFHEETLKKLFKIYNFSVTKCRLSNLPLMNNKLQMPTIEFLLKKERSKLEDGVFCYPVSRECLYKIENSKELKQYNITGFIDDNPDKRNKKINGITIYSSELIRLLSETSTIIITSDFHSEKIQKKILSMNYKGCVKII